MSETLTIRLPAAEKTEWKKAASAVKETVADYVRNAVRQRTQAEENSAWEKHLGSVDASVPPPTNLNIRRAFAQSPRHKR